MALTGDRNTPERSGDYLVIGVAAAAVIHAGGLTVINSGGFAAPGSAAAGLLAAGRAEHQADNSGGGNGAITVKIKRGIFRFANSESGDAITAAQIGSACYIVDDQTVAKTSDNGARSRAGQVIDVDAQGVWVQVGRGLFESDSGTLLDTNNLSDVDDAAAARAELGANLVVVSVPTGAALDGTAPVRVVSPVAGTITKIYSVIDGALTTGNATLTAAINGNAVTNGVVTVTQAGSAAGDIDVASPSAANTVAAGDLIAITPGGTNDAARTAAITLLIET